MPYITIDIGSNSTLVLAASKNKEGGWDNLYEKCETVRFGAAMDENGMISGVVIEECINAIRDFRAVWENLGKSKIKAAATGILRDAKNFDQLKKALESRLGIFVSLLSPDEEARLTYLAVRNSCNLAGKSIVSIDVGGYSTEISWGDKEIPEHIESHKLGCVELTQKYWLENRPSRKTLKEVQKEIRKRWGEYSLPENLKAYKIVGSGGTITTIAALCQELTVYTSEKVHNYKLKKSDIKELLDETFIKNSATDRVMDGVMDLKRAEVILAGALIFHEFMSLFGIDEVLVNEKGLRWGLLYDMAK